MARRAADAGLGATRVGQTTARQHGHAATSAVAAAKRGDARLLGRPAAHQVAEV
jgi:hypothetical protein